MSDSSNPMDCSLPGSSVHGIFQAKVLEWGAIALTTVNLKNIHNQKLRVTFIWWEFLGLQAWEIASQVNLKELL